MSITISDIKRAILDKGDVSVLSEVWHQALGNPPVPSIPSLEAPVALPETTALLRCVNEGLEPLVAAWAEGRNYLVPPKAEVDLTVIGLPPYGRNIASYLEQVIDEVRPDIIAIDTAPLELSANMLYAFSVACAIGLPAYGEILTREGGQFYTSETFYPGNMNETAIVKSWLAKIPLLPVGMPLLKPEYLEADFIMAYVDERNAEREMSKSSVLAAYRALDESLSDVTKPQEGTTITKDICLSLMKAISSKMREVLVEEACYIASRIMEAAACANSQGQKTHILAIADIARYPDTEYAIDLLKQGITDEVYVPPKSYTTATDMVIAGRDADKLNEQAKEYAPELTLTQRLFHSEFDRLITSQDSEILAESEVDKLITEIVSHTRTHPDIARGASVRGTIAFKEILQGLAQVRNGLTRDSIRQAALITLPSRISGKPGAEEIAIINDIVKEVLYGIRFSRVRDETAPSIVLDWLSAKDIAGSLENLRPLSQEQRRELTQKEPPTIIAEPGKSQEMLKYLESRKLQKRGSQYSFTSQAIEYLLDELEKKLRAGEITPDEYNREKERLMAMLRKASEPQHKMSAKELAKTIMELMDAQDKQWSRELGFERMHIYYHIKANSRGDELSPQKRSYYGLKTLIDDLERQGILKTAETATGFILTGEALDMLLEYLIAKVPKGRGLQGAIDFGKTLASERKHEIRRYSSGDVFRDISFRHTLKEIAKQKKELSSVRKSDFRVFMKQKRKLQSDIVLCLDTSASMGPQHKLIYARLVATGLAKAAIENGDRVGVVTFDNFGQTTVPLTNNDKDAIINYIVGLSARGNTNIGDGLKCASQLLFQDRNHNQKYILLITDGQPTAISERDFDRLKALKEKDLTEESAIMETRKASVRGARVSVIHIASKNEVSGKFMKNIAQVGRGRVRRISSPEDLETILR